MKRDRRSLGALVLLASLAAPVAPAHARPAAALGTSGDTIFLFDTANPAQITDTLSLLGQQSGETIVAIDARTDTGVLYALARASGDTLRLYRVDLKSGQLRPVGGPLPPVLSGVQYGLDYNPVSRLFRVINTGGPGNGGVNIRINPDSGALAATDTNLSPEGTFTNAIAYDRNVDGAAQTTQYAISVSTNSLSRIGGIDGVPSPNGGVVVPVGQIGFNIDASAGVGLDIAGASEAYASFQDGTTDKSGLYRVDLATGAATFLGVIGDGNTPIGDLALLFIPDRLYALSSDGSNLLSFDSDSAGTVDATPVTGLANGEALVGIDFRPATGRLYALARGNNILGDFVHLYQLDETTGVATPLASSVPELTSGIGYGMDFNPVSDRLRVVNTSDLNLRLEPELGARVDDPPDTPLTPAARFIDAIAYDRNLARASASTLYGIARNNARLVRIGGVDGVPSPNGGAITDVGALGPVIDIGTGIVGFDIGDRGRGYAVFPVFPTGATNLFRVDLATGAATLIERVGDGTVSASGLTVRPNTLFRDGFE